MTEQGLDLKRSLQILRRRRILVGVLAALGLLAGAGYAALVPSMPTSTALVVLSPSEHDTATQIVIARSNPVLAPVLHGMAPRISLAVLRNRIRVTSPSYNVISITAEGTTAAQAERIANGVARSYVSYVGSVGAPGLHTQGQVLQPATNANLVSLPLRLLDTTGPGLVAGVLVGVAVALALGRVDRRLRGRGEIANAIAAPVLASVFASQPATPAGWRRLLEEYDPGPVDAWRLSVALRHLKTRRNGRAPALAVLSLSSDRKALALGPQLAIFAASTGTPTALVIGPQQDASVTAALRAACTGPLALPPRSQTLQVAVCDDGDRSRLPKAALTIVVGVVDSKEPRVARTMKATTTVLGVSAGAATAEQLARVAASAAADRRHIAGILLADPDPADHTTGRLVPHRSAVQPRIPAQATGMPTGVAQ